MILWSLSRSRNTVVKQEAAKYNKLLALLRDWRVCSRAASDVPSSSQQKCWPYVHLQAVQTVANWWPGKHSFLFSGVL